MANNGKKRLFQFSFLEPFYRKLKELLISGLQDLSNPLPLNN